MLHRLLAACLLSACAAFGARAQITNVVDWGHTWSYMHPMGQLPDAPAGGPDTDFTNTWYLAEADFLANYNGPTFGLVPTQPGDTNVVNTYNSGVGPGPLGYEVINYLTSVGAEFTAFGTTLTRPTTNNRRAAYFRTTFTVPASGLATPQLRYVMDDGGFVYLDGQLIATINIAAGVTDVYTSFAANTTATEDAPVRVLNLGTAGVQGNGNVLIPMPILPAGTHTLAISARNNNATSSDMIMAVQIRGDISCTITPVISGVVRSNGGSPNNPLDDTVTFNAVVTGFNTSSSWTTTVAPFTGTYGVTNSIGPVPVPASGLVTVRFSDSVDGGCFRDVTFNAPGCSMTAIAGGFVHDAAGTLTDVRDDTFTFSLAATGTFGGSGWTSTTAPGAGTYGAAVSMGPLATTNVSHVVTLRDNFTNTCTTAVTVHGPRLMGVSDLGGGAPRMIMDGAVGQNGAWVVSTNLVTTLNNAGNTNLNVRATQSYDISGVSGLVRLRARLVAQDTSTGSNFETEDLLRVSLEMFDGVSTTVTNLTAAFDRNGNGFINGYGGADYNTVPTRDEFNPTGQLLAGAFTTLLGLEYIMPDSVQSFRLILEGANNSASEFYRLDNVRLDTPFCEITATSAGPVVFNNQGDDNPANDTFSQPWTIRPIYVASSTAWTSDATPASGLYTDAQPVTFGPFLVSGGTRSVNLNAGVGSGGCSTNFVVTAPAACALTATAGVLAYQENGPGLADDTFTIATTLSNTNGGVSWTSDRTPAAGAYGPVVFGPFPRSGGAVTIQIRDAAYPTTCTATVTGTPVARFTLGTIDVGSGPVDFGSALGVAIPNWTNNAALRTVRLTNAGAADRVIPSQWIDLSSVSGPLNFSATLAAWDTSNGSNFETLDSFRLDLEEVVGGVTNVVNLVTPYDTDNANGRINGYQGVTNAIHNTAAANYNANRTKDEFNAPNPQDVAASISNNFAFVHTVADNVRQVRLVITGRNDSTTEFYLVKDVVFSTSSNPDTDTDSLPDAWEVTHFGSIGAQSGSGDADGDGSSNYSEYRAGTNPNANGDFLETGDPVVTGGNFSVTWASVAGVSYQLLFSPGPLTPTTTWSNLGSPVTAIGASTTVNGTLPNPNGGYIRIQVVP